MVTPAEAAPVKSFSAAAAVALLSKAASPLTASWTRGCTRSAGTNCRGVSGRCLLTMTHWLAGSLSEYFGDKAPDGGAVEGSAPDGGASLAAGAGTAVVVATDGVGVAVWEPEGDETAAGDTLGLPGVQAAKAVIPTPAARSAVKDLLLGAQLWHIRARPFGAACGGWNDRHPW